MFKSVKVSSILIFISVPQDKTNGTLSLFTSPLITLQ